MPSVVVGGQIDGLLSRPRLHFEEIMKTNVIALLPLLHVLWSPAFLNASPEELEGTAERITDGDTFTLATPTGERRIIRLYQIDAPELAQPFGREARKQLHARLTGKPLRVHVETTDSYRRTIASVFVADSDVSLEMLAAGLAWVNRRFTFADAYAIAETQARNRRAGLWRDPAPMPPWVYRWSVRGKGSSGPVAKQKPVPE